MQNHIIDPAAPEWASRLLKIRGWAEIVGENPATVYRKIDAKIYPGIIRFGSSSRLPGWECWARTKAKRRENREWRIAACIWNSSDGFSIA